MSQHNPSLEQVQRWMQSVIMHPQGVEAAVDSPEARQHLDVDLAHLDTVITRSHALESRERLEIYVDAYYQRLLECLAEEFGVTRRTLGEDLFDALSFGYLQTYPSTSYTLHALGSHFASYLDTTQLHARQRPADAPPHWENFVVELARFERLIREVFDGPGSEGWPPLSVDWLRELPADRWDRLRVQTTPSLRLVELAHPLHEFWDAQKAEEPRECPAARPCFVAVYRHDYSIGYRELSRAEYQLLGGVASGRGVAEAISLVATAPDFDASTLTANLQTWFATWTQCGYITGISAE